MVKFIWDGTEWRLRFRHYEDYKHNRVTDAVLETRLSGSWQYFNVGSVTCYGLDTYDRKVGNFLAFKRLLGHLTLLDGLRTCLWNAYWATTGHPERVNYSVEGDLI